MRRSLHCTLAAFLLVGQAASAATHRVALGSFTSDEYAWGSLQAAETAAPALQASLANLPEVDWVERPQLGVILQEQSLVAFGTSVRAARLTKADWMITGRFVATGAGRELVLEAIDLAHADVLAELHLPLPGAAMQDVPKSLPLIAAGVRSLLDAAAKREREVAGVPALAVLFFPDVDGFQQEFEAALQDPKVVTGKRRLLRLPRASLAAEEAELVLAGFTDDAPDAWRSIADAYVWGTLKRRVGDAADGEEITDARTPEIALNVWDGRLSPVRFIEEGEPVDRAKFQQAVGGQARRLAGRVADFVREPRAGATDAAQRARVSRGLLRASEDLNLYKTYDAEYVHTSDGQRHLVNMVRTLEAACFFNPQNALALERLTRVRWNEQLAHGTKNPRRFQMGRSEAWGRYVDRFGLKSEGPSKSEKIEAAVRNPSNDFNELARLVRSAANEGPPVAREFLRSAIEAFTWPDYPADLPEEEVRKWEDRQAREVARRTILVAGDADAWPMEGLDVTFHHRYGGDFFLQDPRYRIQVLEKVWPAVPIHARPSPSPRLRAAIKLTYERAGQPGGEEPLFASLPQPAPVPPAPRPKP